jgi:hypothetical protein
MLVLVIAVPRDQHLLKVTNQLINSNESKKSIAWVLYIR